MPTYRLMGFANSSVGWSAFQIDASGPANVSGDGLTIEVIDDDLILDDEFAGFGQTLDSSSQLLGNSFGVCSCRSSHPVGIQMDGDEHDDRRGRDRVSPANSIPVPTRAARAARTANIIRPSPSPFMTATSSRTAPAISSARRPMPTSIPSTSSTAPRTTTFSSGRPTRIRSTASTAMTSSGPAAATIRSTATAATISSSAATATTR